MSKWSDSDNYFVNRRSKVYSVVDLSSDPLRWVRRRDVTYDGPDDEDFKSLLFQNDFAVNRQRKVIVRLRERNHVENDDYLRVESMVQEMKELKSLLKENGVQNVKELKSLLDNTKADLGKKSTDVDALQRKILDWNSDELRLTLEAIAAAMKKLFVDFADLRAPPASTDGDSKPVLGFLQKLRDLIVGKAVFQKSLSPSQPVTPAGTDFLGFLLRMNKIFVNKKGRYLKFQFTAVKFPGSPHIHDDQIFYYRKSDKVFDIITRVQYDINESPAAFSSGRGVSLLEQVKTGVAGDTGEDWIRKSSPFWKVAFLFKDSCFVGEVTIATGQVFRRNALVTAFFEQSKLGKLCYVDALATTYFVLNPGPVECWTATQTPVEPNINY